MNSEVKGSGIDKGVSIITPFYNQKSVFWETFTSVCNQSFANWEWIIVNDGSQCLEALEILNSITSDKDQRIIVYHLSENRGLPAARNVGINLSSKNYLFFLDSDDLIAPDYIEKAFIFLELNSQFSFANSFVVGFGSQDYKWTGGFHDREVFLYENRNTSCFLSRREVFNFILFDESMRDGCEDWDFWLNAASNGFWGYTIPEFLFFYRRSSENKWATLHQKSKLMQIKKGLFQRYGSKLETCFPSPNFNDSLFGEVVPYVPVQSTVVKCEKSLLCIFPWLQIGGVDQFNINVLKGLKEKGWRITIATTLKSDNYWEIKFREITDDIYHLAHLCTNSKYISLLTYLVESRLPNLMYLSHSQIGYYLLPILKHRFPFLPIVDYVHCVEPGWYNGGYPYFSSLYSEFIDKTFTTSQNLKDWCIAQGAKSNKIEVVYINVNTSLIKRNIEQRQELRSSLGISCDTPVILFVARLTEQKQPLVYVRTLAILKAQGFVFRGLVIGDGPDRVNMENCLRHEGLEETVVYLGNLPNDEVLKYMDASDIFFLPSLYEGIALSIYEAMAKELAIVGAHVGGQAELVTNDCGFLIERRTFKDDVTEYVKALSTLLSNPTSIHQMGNNGRLRIENEFSFEVTLNHIHTSFLSIAVKEPIKENALQDPYFTILNRMMYLENENSEVQKIINSKAVKILMKLKQPYLKLRNLYFKLRKIINR